MTNTSGGTIATTMCSNEVATHVEAVIEKWTQEGRAFTKLEVTREVQNRLVENKQPFVRHRDIKDYYRQSPALKAALMGDYKATLRDVGAQEDAWVYHPSNYDPTQYQPLDRQNGAHLPAQVPSTNVAASAPVPVSSPSISIGVPTLSISSVAAVAQPKKGTCTETSVNKSGEVWVSTIAVKQAGFNIGEYVALGVINGMVFFEKWTPKTDTGRSKMVENHGNLRLSPTDRSVLGVKADKFNVQASPGKITLTPV
jgi:hypothetical protein